MAGSASPVCVTPVTIPTSTASITDAAMRIQKPARGSAAAATAASGGGAMAGSAAPAAAPAAAYPAAGVTTTGGFSRRVARMIV